MIRPAGVILIALSCSASLGADTDAEWVSKSNEYAKTALLLIAKYAPEGAAELGVDGYDEAILDLRPNLYERKREDTLQAAAQVKEWLKRAEHPKIKQDLQILIQALNDSLTRDELHHRLMVPYFDPAGAAFQGVHALLDAKVDKSRHPAALIRLAKYTGVGADESLTTLAMARSRDRLNVAGLTGPYRRQVQRDIANSQQYLIGIAELMKSYGLAGWEKSHQQLTAQIKDYNAWLESELLPRARDDHRLPAEIYADNLKTFGVHMSPPELMDRAQSGFFEIRSEMEAIARRIAVARGWEKNDYRDVIRELKRQQLDTDHILSVYRQRLEAIEEIIRNQRVVTLPERKARIRIASDAESAGIAAPSMQPPRLIGNTGEFGEFLIPLRNPNAETKEKMDDFLHDAITWTLTAHEARPGHEMQFSALVERGVSIPRAIFAFNSANVEGWGLYSEAIMKEHFPLEGQFFSLHARLMRAARAFLDPMLNLGLLKPEQAKSFLMRELVLSEPMAMQEVDRYTFRAPGQATSYYYGLMKLESLRTRTELALGAQFNQQAFHDFILAQGLLPPELLAEAVLNEFLPTVQGNSR